MTIALLQHAREQYVPLVEVVWPSLLACAGVAAAGGVVGVFVSLRRETLLALMMPQIVTLGAAAGIRMDWPTLPPAVGAVAAAMLMLAASRRGDAKQMLLPVLYVAGACGSILLVANAGRELMAVQNLYTGIDVAVSETQAVVVATTLSAVAVVAAALWRRWLLLAQAPASAQLAGVRPALWNALFLILLATVLVLATDTIGSVLVVALLFLPAATVLPWSRRVPPALAAGVGVALASVCAGFVASVEMGWPLSQSVGAAGVAFCLVSHVGARIVR